MFTDDLRPRVWCWSGLPEMQGQVRRLRASFLEVRTSSVILFPIPGTPWAKTKRLSKTGYKTLVYGSVLQFWKPPFPLYSKKWGVQAPWTTQGSVSGTIWALIWSSGSWNTGVSGQSSTLGWFSWRHWHHQVLQHKSTRHEVTLQHGWRCARIVTACRGAEHTRLNLQERCSADVVCGCENSESTSAVSHMCCTLMLKFRWLVFKAFYSWHTCGRGRAGACWALTHDVMLTVQIWN